MIRSATKKKIEASATITNTMIVVIVVSRRVGQVTSLLHALFPGGRVGLRGPFGTGFPVAEMAGGQILLLAGGLGIAPLRSLLHHLLREPEQYDSVTLMYGAREPAAMLFRDELVALARHERFRLLLTVDFVRDEPVDGKVCTVGLLPALLRGVKVEPAATWVAIWWATRCWMPSA